MCLNSLFTPDSPSGEAEQEGSLSARLTIHLLTPYSLFTETEVMMGEGHLSTPGGGHVPGRHDR